MQYVLEFKNITSFSKFLFLLLTHNLILYIGNIIIIIIISHIDADGLNITHLVVITRYTCTAEVFVPYAPRRNRLCK